jgi:hypothetical protein
MVAATGWKTSTINKFKIIMVLVIGLETMNWSINSIVNSIVQNLRETKLCIWYRLNSYLWILLLKNLSRFHRKNPAEAGEGRQED